MVINGEKTLEGLFYMEQVECKDRLEKNGLPDQYFDT